MMIPYDLNVRIHILTLQMEGNRREEGNEMRDLKEKIEEDHNCPICLDVFYKPVLLATCNHTFCDNCLNEGAVISNQRRCPLCRAPFTLAEVRIQAELWEQMQSLYPEATEAKRQSIAERVMIRFVIGNTTQ